MGNEYYKKILFFIFFVKSFLFQSNESVKNERISAQIREICGEIPREVFWEVRGIRDGFIPFRP